MGRPALHFWCPRLPSSQKLYGIVQSMWLYEEVLMADHMALAWVSRMRWQAVCIIAASPFLMLPRKSVHVPSRGLQSILPKLPSLTGAHIFVSALVC